MRYYILVCSAQKAQTATDSLTWSPNTSIEAWNAAWKNAVQQPVSDMYVGRLFRQQHNMIMASVEPWQIFVVSAGGGLLRGPSSDGRKQDTIPSYEVHCASSSPMKPSKMKALWESGSYSETNESEWTKMDWAKADDVAICLPTAYMEAVMPSLKEAILDENPELKLFVMGSLPEHLFHHLSDINLEVVGGEKGQREAIKSGFTEFRTRVLEHWMNNSLPEPLPVKKIKRIRLNDEQLAATISEMFPRGPPSVQRTLRQLRDNGFAVSLERLKEHLNKK
jgi:hypothetical protein